MKKLFLLLITAFYCLSINAQEDNKSIRAGVGLQFNFDISRLDAASPDRYLIYPDYTFYLAKSFNNSFYFKTEYQTMFRTEDYKGTYRNQPIGIGYEYPKSTISIRNHMQVLSFLPGLEYISESDKSFRYYAAFDIGYSMIRDNIEMSGYEELSTSIYDVSHKGTYLRHGFQTNGHLGFDYTNMGFTAQLGYLIMSPNRIIGYEFTNWHHKVTFKLTYYYKL
jgi:hypothetical protein